MEPNLDDSPRLKPGQNTETVCRICFEAESDAHKLISPCKCSGSMRYIHEECLKIWLLSQDKDLSASECDICKAKFIMKIIVATQCTCKNYWNECLGMFIFPILLILMSSILMVILLFLIQGIQSKKSSAGEQTYLILLVIACTIIIVIILVIFIKAIKRGCCSSEMVSWRIESVPHEDVLEETLEQNANNVTQQPEDVQVMVMPRFSRLNGRNIIRPDIQSPRLVPILRSGEVIGYRSRPITSRSLGASQTLNRSIGTPKVDVSANLECRVVPEHIISNN